MQLYRSFSAIGDKIDNLIDVFRASICQLCREMEGAITIQPVAPNKEQWFPVVATLLKIRKWGLRSIVGQSVTSRERSRNSTARNNCARSESSPLAKASW